VASVTSSISLEANIATAERHNMSIISRQNIQVIGASRVSLASQQSRQSKFRERFSFDGAEHPPGQNSTPIVNDAVAGDKEMTADEKEMKKWEKRRSKTICARVEKMKQKFSKMWQTVGERVTRRFSLWIMTKGLGLDRSGS
jgi:hypothetical protein